MNVMTVFLGSLGFMVLLASSPDSFAIDDVIAPTRITVGRYSTLRAAPTEAQIDLLANIVTVSMPASTLSVGDAVRHLLKDSGYRLASAPMAEPGRAALLRLPLPAVHRSLGPMSVRDALETLAGPAFRLVEDPVHRLVSFELCDPSSTINSSVQVRTTG